MPRKIHDGAIKSQERTKLKLLEAVGEIIRVNGYAGLRVNKVADQAGIAKKMIYHYFGSLDNLVEAYVRGKDYWVALAEQAKILAEANKDNYARELAPALLLNQLESLYNDVEMQQIIRWQFSEHNEVMFEVCETREKIGTELFNITDPFFEHTDVDLRARVALLIGGIYSLVLHARTSKSLFCEIDINTRDGMARVKKELEAMIREAYEKADRQKAG